MEPNQGNLRGKRTRTAELSKKIIYILYLKQSGTRSSKIAFRKPKPDPAKYTPPMQHWCCKHGEYSVQRHDGRYTSRF